MTKRALREEARALRRALPAHERDERAARIAEHALALPELDAARVVGCYVSVGSEVDTRRILRALLARGTLVAVPTVHGERLRFARLDHPWALAPGERGIPEPREPRTEVAGDDIEVLYVPGLRFGRDGSRLGNGGGHFDRFLADHPRALRVGLAFDAQLVDALATEPHDQGMDVVVTESGRLRVGRPVATGAGDDKAGPTKG